MVQDIFPHKLNNQYDPKIQPTQEDFVFMFRGNQVVVRIRENSEKSIEFPRVRDLRGEGYDLIYLFSIDEERYFLYWSTEPAEKSIAIPEGCEWVDMYRIRTSTQPTSEGGTGTEKARCLRYASFTGKHLSDWYTDTRFCGRCGCLTKHSSIERAKVCPNCGYTAYPRIMPAVIVGVINQDKILLTKYARGYGGNALVAGFTEIGETMEETVAREVMEEVGLKVKNIRYYKSQPWGTANDILLGYYCDVDGDDTVHMDDGELKQAIWTKAEDIVLQEDEASLTNEMMMRFKHHEIR